MVLSREHVVVSSGILERKSGCQGILCRRATSTCERIRKQGYDSIWSM